MTQEHEHQTKKQWHDLYYKKLLLIPAALLLLALISLGMFYAQTGDFFKKDISLTGGTSVTINEPLDTETLLTDLGPQLDSLHVRAVYDLVTREQKAVILQTKTSVDEVRTILESYLGFALDEANSSFEFTGSSLSESFYQQLLIAILVAFVFMAIVVFILFRTAVPSLAVIICAFADIVMTLAFVNILGIEMSAAGIVALLMLVGYSVDTDILLTTRMLKRDEGTLNERIYGAFKTGTTMTLTSLIAVGIALIIVQSFSVVLTEIFTILVIGLFFDLINTWITNVSILKWYVRKKGGKK